MKSKLLSLVYTRVFCSNSDSSFTFFFSTHSERLQNTNGESFARFFASSFDYGAFAIGNNPLSPDAVHPVHMTGTNESNEYTVDSFNTDLSGEVSTTCTAPIKPAGSYELLVHVQGLGFASATDSTVEYALVVDSFTPASL